MDKKELEQEYIRSYDFSGTQRVVAWVVTIFFLGATILGGTALFIGLINLIKK